MTEPMPLALVRGRAVVEHVARGAVGRDDAQLVGDGELRQRLGGASHRLQIGARAHHDADLGVVAHAGLLPSRMSAASVPGASPSRRHMAGTNSPTPP